MAKVRLSAVQRAMLQRLADSPSGSDRAYSGASQTYYALQDKGLIELAARDPVNVIARITDAGRAALAQATLPPSAQCQHRTSTGVLSTRRCTRPATKDGYCTRHHPSYVSPSTRRYLAELDAKDNIDISKIGHGREA